MKLEDQVCSLDLAKRLKELGMKQDSAIGWYEMDRFGKHEIHLWMSEPIISSEWQHTAALTVADLGEMLPDDIKFWRDDMPKKGTWNCDYGTEPIQVGDTEANARAKMLIYLIENRLVL